MTSPWKSLPLLGLLYLAMASILLAGCAVEDNSLIVRGVLIATPSGDTTGSSLVCSVPLADPNALQVPFGAIDTGIASEYRAPILVMNQIVSQSNTNKLKPETSHVQLQAADVRIEDASGNQLVRSNGADAAFTAPLSGFIQAAVGAAPGFGTAMALFIDSATAADLAKTLKKSGKTMNLVVKMVVRGTTLGGQEIASPEFAFPIEASYGGLVDCVTGPGCLEGATEPVPSCRVGIDIPTDCRLCSGREVCACNAE